MTDSIAATKILVDTNILIYAADLQAGDKHFRAVELVDDLTAQNRMVVSAQVLMSGRACNRLRSPTTTRTDFEILRTLFRSCRCRVRRLASVFPFGTR